MPLRLTVSRRYSFSTSPPSSARARRSWSPTPTRPRATTRPLIQDDDGNDAASFTTGADDVPAVTNSSTVQPVVPGAPRNLETEAPDDTTIVLTWDPPADNGGRVVASYRIEYSEDVSPRVWQALVEEHDESEDGAIVTRYEDSGLESGATRHYRVRAKNSVGDGAWSDEVEGVTVPEGAPGPVRDLKAEGRLRPNTDDETQIRLNWRAPADTGASAITGYRYEYSEDVDPRVWQEGGIVTQRGALQSDLGSEVTRHYRVRAINDQGEGRWSQVSAITPDVAGPVPASASAPADGRSVAVVFDEALDETAGRLPAAARFAVTASDGARFRIAGVAVSDKTVTLNLKTDSGFPTVRTGQALTVVYTDATAGNDAGGVVQDDDGNDAAGFTLGPGRTVEVTNNSSQAVTAPGAPGNVGTESGGDRITVSWDAPADTGGRAVTGYRIEVCPSSCDQEANWQELVADQSATTYAHTGLSVGDVRHYRVSARNAPGADGLGPASASVRGITLAPGRAGRAEGAGGDGGGRRRGGRHDRDPTSAGTCRTDTGGSRRSPTTASSGRRTGTPPGPGSTPIPVSAARHMPTLDGGLAARRPTRHYRVFAVNDAGRGPRVGRGQHDHRRHPGAGGRVGERPGGRAERGDRLRRGARRDGRAPAAGGALRGDRVRRRPVFRVYSVAVSGVTVTPGAARGSRPRSGPARR